MRVRGWLVLMAIVIGAATGRRRAFGSDRGRIESEPRTVRPYPSALDLPSMQELLRNVEGGKLATHFIARDQRPTFVAIEAEVRHLAAVVDRFYALLGPRNWIYHEDLPVTAVESILEFSAEEAERHLIDFYRTSDSMALAVRRLARFPELQPRMRLIDLAFNDWQAGRFYSAIHVLLSVMDGFVNDVDPDLRRGLHTRESDELGAWDSVVGHHLGLAHAHDTFNRTFRKRRDDPVDELYRNGIVHGMLTNYDTDVVAAKAWNRLFAVTDWATSRIRQAEPPKKARSWGETLALIQRNTETRRALDAWQTSTLEASDPAFEHDPAVEVCRRYLAAWVRRNYGEMAALVSPFWAEKTPGQTAGMVRESMADYRLTAYKLGRIDHPAAAVATVDCVLEVNGDKAQSRIRLIRSGADGHGVAPNEDGEWRLMTWTYFGMRNEATT